MAGKAIPTPSKLPSAEDLDKVAADQNAADKTAPSPSSPGIASAESAQAAGAPIATSPAQAALMKANAVKNEQNAPQSDSIDSVGKPKQPTLGPRGANAPRDSKPAPQKRADQTKVTTSNSDTTDNAGQPKVGHGTEHHVGIRGTHTSRDTYKL